MGRGRPKGARGSELLRVLNKKDAAAAKAAQAEEVGFPNTRMPCPGLWKTPVIRWDGELMACCADVDGDIAVGNLRDADFDQLWFGEAMTHYRLLHIEGRFEEIDTCWTCGGINFYKMTPEEVRSYLTEVDRLDLWPAYTGRMSLDDEGRALGT
ncbi:MAG: SPASM domain-containing protein [Myxococcota bacterium]|nr:SPASM domain-containing protein [Myxococcota bacterium]